jgi:hypothetical protein
MVMDKAMVTIGGRPWAGNPYWGGADIGDAAAPDGGVEVEP